MDLVLVAKQQRKLNFPLQKELEMKSNSKLFLKISEQHQKHISQRAYMTYYVDLGLKYVIINLFNRWDL